MNVETAASAALAEIERNLATAFDPNPPKLHDRPRLTTAGIDYPKAAEPAIPSQPAPPRNLPAMIAQLQASIDSWGRHLGDRLERIEAFLGLEGEP